MNRRNRNAYQVTVRLWMQGSRNLFHRGISFGMNPEDAKKKVEDAYMELLEDEPGVFMEITKCVKLHNKFVL